MLVRYSNLYMLVHNPIQCSILVACHSTGFTRAVDFAQTLAVDAAAADVPRTVQEGRGAYGGYATVSAAWCLAAIFSSMSCSNCNLLHAPKCSLHPHMLHRTGGSVRLSFSICFYGTCFGSHCTVHAVC